MNKQKAFSLIEILVALIITAIGLLGLASMQMKSLRAEANSLSRSQAILMANDLANRIYANERHISFYITPQAGFSCTNIPQPTVQCADHSTGQMIDGPVGADGEATEIADTNKAAVECTTSQEVANFDRWDAMCRDNVDTGIKNMGSNYMANPRISISCNNNFLPTVCGPSPNMDITISWINRSRTTDLAADNELNTETLSYTLSIRP